MTVQFNLRSGRSGKDSTKDKTATNNTISVFAAAFLLLSAIFFMYGGYKLFSLKSQCAETKDNLALLKAKMLLLNREYDSMKKRSEASESRYDFVLEGMPSAEFLSALSDAAPDGVIIGSVTMNGTGCSLSGMAYDDEEILEFTEKLGATPAVAQVALPVITTGKVDGMPLKKYSVEITLNSLAEILLPHEQTKPDDNAQDDAVDESKQNL